MHFIAAAHVSRQVIAGLVVSLSLLAGCASVGPATPAPAVPQTLAAGDFGYAQARLSWFIGEEMRRSQLTGLSIALVQDQRIVWAQGFGWADREAQRPATAETVYRVGSISKLFTATAAMRLVDAGRLALDAPLTQALPDLALRSRFTEVPPPTLRQVMTHHAGLPSDLGAGMWVRHPAALETLPEAVRGDYLSHPPGHMLAYSNLGYSLLGLAVQRAAGEPFEQHLQRTLLAPLGMRTARFSAQPDAPGLAQAYARAQRTEEPGLRDVPAGGLNASVNDLARLAQMVFAAGRAADGTTLLPPATLAEMLRPQNEGVALDLDTRIGLAWFIGQGPRGTRLVSHDGATPGFSARLSLLPDRKLAVVVLSNTARAADALRRIDREALRLALEAQTGQTGQTVQTVQTVQTGPADDAPANNDAAAGAAQVPQVPQAVPWSAAELAELPGDYVTPFGLATVRAEGDALKVDALGRTLALQRGSDGQARLSYRALGLWRVNLGALDGLGLSPATLDGHRVLVARTPGGHRSVLGERIAPAPLPPDAGRWLGRYVPVGVPAGELSFIRELRVHVLRGHLVADVQSALFNRQVQAVLAPVPGAPGEAITRGLGRGMGETVFLQPGSDGSILVKASGQWLRRVAPE